MVKNLNQRLNEFLKNERIPKENYDDLKNVANLTNFNVKILEWFKYIQDFEITGWRSKEVTSQLCRILQEDKPIHFYALFCPSYIKGEGAVGFRKDDVGNTTKNGLKKLMEITQKTKELGFQCDNPEAIFFDIALEQPDKTLYMLDDLKVNIENFYKYVPEGMEFHILSHKFPELMAMVGYEGIIKEPLPVDEIILKRVIERGKKFYQLFGWDTEKIINRSKVIVSSEATVGEMIRNEMPDAIMIYTPTMLERAQIYSGKRQENPLAILIPKKEG